MNEAILSLNWLAGCSGDSSSKMAANNVAGESADQTLSGMQQMVITRMEGLVQDQKPNGVLASPEEALRSLLRGSSPYDGTGANETLAPYKAELVSLPADIKGCPMLTEVLAPCDRLFLQEQSEQMLRGPGNEDDCGITPYWDPVLRYNRKEYNKLVKRLNNIGYFNFTTKSLCFVGIFFVWKSSRTKLRMITDARLSNQIFKDAPAVSLLTSEGLGRIEVEAEGAVFNDAEIFDQLSVFVGLSDVENCFHRLQVPYWLSRYFCWSAVPAKEVGLSGSCIDGILLGDLDPVYPCAGSLCQGFSWALYLAQKANEQMCQTVQSLSDAKLASDRGQAGFGPRLFMHSLLCVC